MTYGIADSKHERSGGTTSAEFPDVTVLKDGNSERADIRSVPVLQVPGDTYRAGRAGMVRRVRHALARKHSSMRCKVSRTA